MSYFSVKTRTLYSSAKVRVVDVVKTDMNNVEEKLRGRGIILRQLYHPGFCIGNQMRFSKSPVKHAFEDAARSREAARTNKKLPFVRSNDQPQVTVVIDTHRRCEIQSP
ncbi:hypothetical protein MMYC01_210352 [Madurella mycetomatis]|uniref:Uncharacterized protein n=1 Tax=Madurella mycetomatis TaxID=100816 RepID=A0A175VPT1_9PEZI|nr:hypothetical protein MMYC01_210352 [Madurella mycetomatis]